MTQARLVNTIPQWSDCSVYRFMVRDPNTNYTTRRVGYIGETARMPLDRLIEHLRKKPWGDTIVGWEIIEDGCPDKASVLVAEKAAVLAEKPLYNDEYQRNAPHRIPEWDQKRQRMERDAARATSRGNGMTQSTKAPRPNAAPTSNPQRQPARKPPRLPARWRRRRNWAFAWLASTLGLWAVLALLTARVVVQWQVLPIGAAGAVSAAYVFHLPKRRRKTAWTIVGVVTLVLAALVLAALAAH